MAVLKCICQNRRLGRSLFIAAPAFGARNIRIGLTLLLKLWQPLWRQETLQVNENLFGIAHLVSLDCLKAPKEFEAATYQQKERDSRGLNNNIGNPSQLVWEWTFPLRSTAPSPPPSASAQSRW